ncbi:GNAT family N-acetyltransferase [Pseudoalteromonas sp. T1lg75]|uniref:GNAT family N-acetyltransferase n=1 Tax=Pseudoalteromonas sp. T1lg75 TaxID=2077102 RepID=UPI002D783B3F|nr:GNAT family N-acetyltransferase [Pseudoalteromonas sp. T1lg75]
MIKIPDSERLSYRQMTLDDGDLLFELDQDPAVMRYINGGKPSTREDIDNIALPRLSKYLNPEKGWGLWQVTEKTEQRFLGWILVRPYQFFSEQPQWHNLELGWRFKQISWGKGYAIEAAAAVVQALREQSEVSHFCAIAEQDNLGSVAIMKKLGMEYVRNYVHHDPLGDWDVVYYEMAAR